MMPIAPCKDCCLREAGCHSRCPAYLSFVEENKKFRKEWYRKREEENYFNRPKNLYFGRKRDHASERDFG